MFILNFMWLVHSVVRVLSFILLPLRDRHTWRLVVEVNMLQNDSKRMVKHTSACVIEPSKQL